MQDYKPDHPPVEVDSGKPWHTRAQQAVFVFDRRLYAMWTPHQLPEKGGIAAKRLIVHQTGSTPRSCFTFIQSSRLAFGKPLISGVRDERL
ncbi:MAG: hypothetical protein IPG76_06905 [Acidobacteria bacterium]|nr:hypothetical protein [Acidobacteriota bacterium]